MYQYAIPVWILCGLVLFAFARGFRKNYRAVKAGTRPSKRFRKGCKLAAIFSVGTAIFSVIFQSTYTIYGATIIFLGMPVSITAAVITTAISFEHPKLFAKDFWAQSYQAQAPSAPKGPLPREEIEKQMRARAERLKTIVQVSKRLKVARIAEVLEMDEKELWKHIFDWAKDFGFQIDDDMVTFNVDQVEAFIKKLDSEFETWTRSADKTN